MPRTSKKLFNKDFKNEVWKPLFEDLEKAKGGGDVEKIIGYLLPPDEKTMFEKRLAILEFLKEGVPIREISRRMSVTRRTITFLRSGFKQRSNGKGWKPSKGYPDRIWKNRRIKGPWPLSTKKIL